MTCQVCGSQQSESHFGGMSCRACAAFFRRYFNSKKPIIGCSCKTKSLNSHPCRSCRVEKCLAIGMTPQKVCRQRDLNGKSIIRSKTKFFENNFSSLNVKILPKDTKNIISTIRNFLEFEKKRTDLFSNVAFQNVFGVTSLTKNDEEYTCQLVSQVFPDFQELSSNDKRALLHSFLIKLWQIEPILDDVANRVKYRKMEEKDIQNIMFPFFKGCFMEGADMSEEEIWRVFGPRWTYFYDRIIEPICALALDQIELMAIIWILFFDFAYINISEKSSNMCWNIKKVILRELKNYLQRKFLNEEEKVEYRFLQILDVPLIVERGEQTFLEDFMLCELNNIRIHDDCKAVLKKQRI